LFGVAHSGDSGCAGVAERDAADDVTCISGTFRIDASAGVSAYADTGINAAIRTDTGASAG